MNPIHRRRFCGLISSLASYPITSLKAWPSPSTRTAARQLRTGCPVPDPYCTRSAGGWHLIGTQHSADPSGRLFTLFQSSDLQEWHSLGPILDRPDYAGSERANYWAPELVKRGGQHFLYYTADSYGDPERRFLRAAVGEKISGPYQDSGKPLVQQPSIDGHPYFPNSGPALLYYCGNEGNTQVGQLLLDRFKSPLELENRPEKVFPSETVEWEEGPFVVHHAGACYLFSSMGNWRDGSYHVRVARAESAAGPWQRLLHQGEPYHLLTTVEGQWGPGHNSVFQGPDNQWWICYHAWDREKTGRYPWIAPIFWDHRGYPVVHQ